MASQLSEAEAALQFMLGGRAIFTLASQKTGARYTYKVTKKNVFYFVNLLTGPDNTRDYTYLGMISQNQFRLTHKSKMLPDSPPIKAITFTLKNLVDNRFPPQLEFWHEGRCGRCGRLLTVPESIASGFGPECINLI